MNESVFIRNMRRLLQAEGIPFEEQQVGLHALTFYIPSLTGIQISIHVPQKQTFVYVPYDYEYLDHSLPGDGIDNIYPAYFDEVEEMLLAWKGKQ